jgi:hypothetical protein
MTRPETNDTANINIFVRGLFNKLPDAFLADKRSIRVTASPIFIVATSGVRFHGVTLKHHFSVHDLPDIEERSDFHFTD